MFAAARQNRGNYKLPQHIWCCDSDLTWLKQPCLRPPWCAEQAQQKPNLVKPPVKEAETESEKNPPQWKWQEAQGAGSQGAKTNLAESLHGSVSSSRRPPVKVGSPCSYGWKEVWLRKSLFLYNLLFLAGLCLVTQSYPTGTWTWPKHTKPGFRS